MFSQKISKNVCVFYNPAFWLCCLSDSMISVVTDVFSGWYKLQHNTFNGFLLKLRINYNAKSWLTDCLMRNDVA